MIRYHGVIYHYSHNLAEAGPPTLDTTGEACAVPELVQGLTRCSRLGAHAHPSCRPARGPGSGAQSVLRAGQAGQWSVWRHTHRPPGLTRALIAVAVDVTVAVGLEVYPVDTCAPGHATDLFLGTGSAFAPVSSFLEDSTRH
jgi:hypothetical protein